MNPWLMRLIVGASFRAHAASFSRPLTFSGIFRYPTIPPTNHHLSLFGSGTATLNVAWRTDRFWTLDNVPEPRTLLLVGFGAVSTSYTRASRALRRQLGRRCIPDKRSDSRSAV